jgi:hypothetical protein
MNHPPRRKGIWATRGKPQLASARFSNAILSLLTQNLDHSPVWKLVHTTLQQQFQIYFLAIDKN